MSTLTKSDNQQLIDFKIYKRKNIHPADMTLCCNKTKKYLLQ